MPDLKQALKTTDVLTINDDEARQLSEEYSLLEAAKDINDGTKVFNNKKR